MYLGLRLAQAGRCLEGGQGTYQIQEKLAKLEESKKAATTKCKVLCATLESCPIDGPFRCCFVGEGASIVAPPHTANRNHRFQLSGKTR